MAAPGWILGERGDAVHDLKLLKAASEKAPESTGVRCPWAAALAKSGDHAGSIRRSLSNFFTFFICRAP